MCWQKYTNDYYREKEAKRVKREMIAYKINTILKPIAFILLIIFMFLLGLWASQF